MKVLRATVLLGLMISTIMAGVPARAAHTSVPPIDRSPLPSLAGDTTVVGNETAWMRVRLPKPLATEEIDGADLKVRGHGRLFGILMVREIDGEIKPRQGYIDILRSGMCNKPGCKPKPMAMISGGAATQDGKLPAGIYRLYLLADGGRVSVDFSTPELPGAVRLNPRRPARSMVQNLTPRVQVADTGVIYSAGDERPFRGRGFVFQAQWVDPMGAGVIARDFCIYPKEPPADQTTAYLPPECPVDLWWELLTLTYSTYSPASYSDRCCWEMHQAANFLPKAIGSYYTLTSPAEHYGAATLWLKF